MNKPQLSVSDVHCLNEGNYFARITDASGTTLDTRSALLSLDPSAIVIDSGGRGTTPYPATVRFFGPESATITRVAVTVSSLYHPRPMDLIVLLVSPAGQSALLMSNAGGSFGIPQANPVTLTFSDDYWLPPLPTTTLITSGSYKPSPFNPIIAPPPPAPSTQYGTTMSVFNGFNPNGRWLLYVYDKGTANAVGKVIGSWCLDITTAP